MIIPPWAYAAAGVALVAASFGAGWQVRAWRCDAEIADIRQEIQDAADRQRLRFDKASTDYEQTRSTIATEAHTAPPTVRTIYRDLPPAPATCEPAADALRVLDTALSRSGTATGEPVAAMP